MSAENVCLDCREPFVIDDAEQAFYVSQGWPLAVRCRQCRRERRSRRTEREAINAPAREGTV
jgi:hypothetical protein